MIETEAAFPDTASDLSTYGKPLANFESSTSSGCIQVPAETPATYQETVIP